MGLPRLGGEIVVEVDGVVPVLEVDPDLGAGVSHPERAEAQRTAVAAVGRLDSGSWTPPDHAEAGHLGLLVLDGLLTRELRVGGRKAVELLASGDVLRPWVAIGDDAPATVKVGWTVMQPASMAVLDAAFARRVSRWPQIAASLMDRLVMRTRWLALDLAVSHVRRVDDRLMLLFWQFARRFGRVTPRGVVIPLHLQHQLIAGLIGAQRPSVTTRLGVLRTRGLLRRESDGSWLLPGNGGTASVEELHRAVEELTPA